MSAKDGNDVEIAVSFVTRLPEEFRVADAAITVPGKLTRYGLSEVVNHLLGRETPMPFDFLVDGNLLRTSLAKLALRLGKSAEATMVVEYVPALGPPTPAEESPCQEWVSSVDGSWAKAVATGSFDGKARLWTPKGKLLCELEGHEAHVCSVSLAPSTSSAEDTCVVLTASADRTVRSHVVTVDGKKCSFGEQRVFKGHEATVTDVAACYAAPIFATTSVDRTARLWKIGGGEIVEEKVTKKRKTSKKSSKENDDDGENDGDDDAEKKIGLGEELVLRGHTDRVQAVAWESAQAVWTGSYDCTVRSWDVETGEEKEKHSTSSGVHCLAVAEDGNKMAWGGADRIVSVWDPRETTSKACLKLKSHEGWISSVRWSPSNVNHLVSSGYDGAIKMWDIRGKLPLHSVTTHKGKNFAVDYHGGDRLASGGDDGKLRFWNVGVPKLQ